MHRWPAAPEAVGFLRFAHRHVFHVELRVDVTHDDRDVEFILLKRSVDAEIKRVLRTEDTSTWSCERWATHLFDHFVARSVEVSEDGENGAVITR